MIFGSVCSGIEAASVAFEPLGWKAAWFSEIEPFPCDVLAHHYPAVPNLGDMTALPERILSGEVVAPDILVGGTPCQAFSVAGLRKSLDDHRGNLSLIFCEIANAIDTIRLSREQQPAVIFWENVCGVLSTKDNAFGCFLAGIAGEDQPLEPPGKKWTNAGVVLGSKRAVAWRILDAQYFGLAQRRRRVFVVASARDGFNPAEILFEFDGLRRDIAPSREQGKTITHDIARCLTNSGKGFERAGNTRGQDAVVAYSTSGAGYWREDIGALRGRAQDSHENILAFGGNNTSGHIDVATALSACSSASGRMDFASETFVVSGVAGAINASMSKGKNGQDTGLLVVHGTQDPCCDENTAFALGRNSGQENVLAFRAAGQDGFLPSDISPPIAATDGGGAGVPSVAYGIPGNWIGRKPENCSNTVDPLVDIAPCQTRTDVHAVATNMAVRRLTPLECERLQGFPDGYSSVPYRGKPAADSPRYKALGNSWAVPVVRWIGERINNQLRN